MERTTEAQNLPTKPLRWAAPTLALSVLITAIALANLFGPSNIRVLPISISLILLVGGTGAGACTIIPLIEKRSPVMENASKAFKQEIDTDSFTLDKVDDPRIKERLVAYLKKHPVHQLTLDQILTHAKEGKQLVKQMINGADVDATPENVLRVVWYLITVQLAEEGRGYDSWVWKLEDPNGKLTTFFQSLPNSYERISTHFHGLDAGKQMGYNVTGGYLPSGKRTILSIPLNPEKYGGRKFLAVKFETWGAFNLSTPHTWAHGVMHSFDYLDSLKRKAVGGNGKAGTRKEHLPSELKPFATKYGAKRISELRDYAVDDLELAQALDPYDNLAIRDGHEIILDKDSLTSTPSHF